MTASLGFLGRRRVCACRAEVLQGSHGDVHDSRCTCVPAESHSTAAKQKRRVRKKDLKILRTTLSVVRRFVARAHALRTVESDDLRATCRRLSLAYSEAAKHVHPGYKVKCDAFSTGALRTADNAIKARLSQTDKGTKGACRRLKAEFERRAHGLLRRADVTCSCNRCAKSMVGPDGSGHG